MGRARENVLPSVTFQIPLASKTSNVLLLRRYNGAMHDTGGKKNSQLLSFLEMNFMNDFTNAPKKINNQSTVTSK